MKERKKNIENPEIPERVYRRDIKPHIGALPADSVTSRDIYDIVQRINDSGRPTVANDALDHCKHMFTQAIILNVIENNPASILTPKHAGGTEESRTRNLQFSEIKIALSVMRTRQSQFTRDNYIAVCLLLALGVRKCELIAARWSEFDLKKQLWMLPKSRTKKKGILELPNRMKESGIQEPFTIHDLRRTCCSRLSGLKIASNVAEKCLNHKIKGVEGVCDQWGYFDERRDALNALTDKLALLW